MEFVITIPRYGDLAFAAQPDEVLAGYVIAGSEVHYACGGYGQLLLQRIVAPGGTTYFSVFRCEENCTLQCALPGPAWLLHLLLQCPQQWLIDGLGRQDMQVHQCNFYYFRDVRRKGFFRRGLTYLFFDLLCREEMLLRFRDHFPHLRHFMQQAAASPCIALLPSPPDMTGEMWLVVRQLIHAQDDDPGWQLYSNHLENLLLRFFRQAGQPACTTGEKLPEHLEKIYRAEQLIRRDLLYQSKLSRIAARLDMSERTLARGFLSLFGCSPGVYRRRIRMEKAAELLRNGRHSVREVAQQIGFSSQSNFVQSFKKEFGLTPRQWQRSQHRGANGDH